MASPSDADLGGLLRQHRQAAGLTQERLAELAGLRISGIQKLERGATRPYRDTAQRLAETLQLDPEEHLRFSSTVRPVRRRGTPQPHEFTTRHNMPLPVNGLIGRESELLQVAARLATTRLLTLTGIGGCGKTRLALELARRISANYADGVWLVELAPVVDAKLVPLLVGAVVGIREPAELPLVSTIV